MNEEEVKIKIVLPYLQRLGLQPSDLHFESTFSLQIGSNKVQINGRKPKRENVGGRLDILIKRCGTNLLILELKESGHALTDDDRDQAISYARLVHPIAPYALLTNGNEWQIFDTISKERLKSEDLKIKDVYQLVLPDAARDEALTFFLGYSAENLLQFCHSQINEQLKPLIGSPQDLTKKYIPQLTTPRASLLGELASFENASTNGFLLLDESGVGKTSALCDYALRRLAERKPTLFFSGVTLEDGLLSAIASEFGWVFSEELNPINLIRRLSEIAKDAPVVVVLDGIDEWPYSQRAQSLVTLLRGSRDYRVKFVFSCRTGAWEGISQPFGSDIGFAPYLFPATDRAEPKGAHQLGPFADPEFYRAIENYREVFNVRGAFEDKALIEARTNPFLLRVMFAVAAELGEKHLTFSSREFFEKYLDLILRKCGRRDLAQAQILALAKLMFDRNKEQVSEVEARVALSLSANESLLSALFEQNILQHSGDGYTFYFQHLRSYLIAFKLCGWPSAKPADLAMVGRSGVQCDALAFYLRYATSDQIQVLTDPIWKNATEYLKLYAALAIRHFAQLDGELVPGDGRDLGFVGEYVVHRNILGGYGFRRCKPNEPSVLLVPADESFSKSNLLHLSGANRLHHFGTSNGFRMLDIQKEVIEHELIERVTRAIEQRHLNLHGCEKLASEALVSAVCQNRQTFVALLDPDSKNVRYPVSVKDAHEAIQRAQLRCHFEHEVIENKRRKGLLGESWSGGFVSYSPAFSETEKREIAAAIDQAISTGKFPVSHVVETNLRDLERMLNRTGVFESLSAIEQSPWPTEYGLRNVFSENYTAGLDLLREHLRILYEEFLRTYRIVVDTNFPTLTKAFALRAKMPVRLFLDVIPFPSESRHELRGQLVSAFQSLYPGEENEVVLCSPGDLVAVPTKGIRYRDQLVSGAYQVSLDLERKMYSMGDPLLMDMVYARIAKEWPAAANYLREVEGISNQPNKVNVCDKVFID